MPTDNKNVTDPLAELLRIYPLPWQIWNGPTYDQILSCHNIAIPLREIVSAVNTTQQHWTPATTPPTSTGLLYCVAVWDREAQMLRHDVLRYNGAWFSDVRYYLPTPLPELPEGR